MRYVTILTTSDGEAGTTRLVQGDVQLDLTPGVRDLNLPIVPDPVWIFIDWLLPETAGLELCRRFRADPRWEHARIVILLDHDDDEDKRRALKAGADDYIVKPVSKQQIIDRALAGIAGVTSASASLSAGKLIVDLETLQAQWEDRPLWLAPSQFRLLCFFMRHRGRVVSRHQIVAGLAEEGKEVDPQTVSVWVKRLRQSLKQVGASSCLRTVRPRGYALDL